MYDTLLSLKNIRTNMEFKYFSFYKSISNFATNLIGIFLPLLVYEHTGLFYLAILFYVSQYLLNILFSVLLKKLIYSKPQLLLLYRIIPFVLYSICILLLEINVFVFAVPLCIFYSLNVAMSAPPEEIILNYSSEENYSEHLGISDFLTYLFACLSVVAGGYILDNINSVVLTIISATLYAISLVPLIIFYSKNKNKATFNQELTTNAVEQDKNEKVKESTRKALIKKYSIILGLTFCIDACYALVSLLVYTKFDLFTISAVIYGMSDLLYGISSLFVGKWHEKKDISLYTKISAFICGIAIVFIPFMDNQIVLMLVVCVLSILEPLLIVYLSDNMIQKTRVLGVSNSALFYYTNSFWVTTSICVLTGIAGTLIPSFALCGIGTVAVGFMIDKHEKDTNDLVISYLDQVKIAKKRKSKRKPSATVK